MSQNISFRVNTETYLKIEALAAEKGLSPGLYIKKRLENESENIFNDVKLMQTDLRDILHILTELRNKAQFTSPATAPTHQQSLENPKIEKMLLETLMILREISQPAKIASAQKQMLAVGVEPYSSLDN